MKHIIAVVVGLAGLTVGVLPIILSLVTANPLYMAICVVALLILPCYVLGMLIIDEVCDTSR